VCFWLEVVRGLNDKAHGEGRDRRLKEVAFDFFAGFRTSSHTAMHEAIITSILCINFRHLFMK